MKTMKTTTQPDGAVLYCPIVSRQRARSGEMVHVIDAVPVPPGKHLEWRMTGHEGRLQLWLVDDLTKD